MSQPITRDLSRIVEACEIVEAELLFQATRLEGQVRPERSGSDPEHLGDLREGYEHSARYVGILKRYQQGRLERQGAPPALPEGDGSIDENGRAVAHVDA